MLQSPWWQLEHSVVRPDDNWSIQWKRQQVIFRAQVGNNELYKKLEWPLLYTHSCPIYIKEEKVICYQWVYKSSHSNFLKNCARNPGHCSKLLNLCFVEFLTLLNWRILDCQFLQVAATKTSYIFLFSSQAVCTQPTAWACLGSLQLHAWTINEPHHILL